jgi:hypothetical protein
MAWTRSNPRRMSVLMMFLCTAARRSLWLVSKLRQTCEWVDSRKKPKQWKKRDVLDGTWHFVNRSDQRRTVEVVHAPRVLDTGQVRCSKIAVLSDVHSNVHSPPYPYSTPPFGVKSPCVDFPVETPYRNGPDPKYQTPPHPHLPTSVGQSYAQEDVPHSCTDLWRRV